MTTTTLDRVIESIALVTRYPSELLTASADLENDLGIDSVKLLEIVMALSDEFDLQLTSNDRDASIRTIQDVANWIDRLLQLSDSQSRKPSTDVTAITEYPPSDAAVRGSDQTLQSNQQAKPPAKNSSSNGSIYGARSTEFVVTNAVANADALAAKNVAAKSWDGGITDSVRPIRFLRQDQQSSPMRISIPSTREHQMMNRQGPLSGRVALVTGSGRGVGRTIARRLASEGATVIVNSFHSREQGEQTASDIIAEGGRAVHCWGSVANSAHVEHIFGQIEEHFGRLDILVCNASDGRLGSFMELTSEDWERAFRTNVVGHHHCAKLATPLMRAGGGGSIVTLSAVGSSGFIDGLGSQGVVKAAVETMTRYLACELGPFGIRVNCVVGGPVYGDLLSKFTDSRMTQNHWEAITADRELCSPMDLANAIAFLASDQARGVNGSVWMVDHGFSASADGRHVRRNVAAHVD